MGNFAVIVQLCASEPARRCSNTTFLTCQLLDTLHTFCIKLGYQQVVGNSFPWHMQIDSNNTRLTWRTLLQYLFFFRPHLQGLIQALLLRYAFEMEIELV